MYQYVLYKPKKDNTGLAANFQVSQSTRNDKTEWNCFLTLGKQIPSKGENDAFDWKDEKGKNKNTIKLGLPDLSTFLALFNSKVAEAKIYHDFEKDGKKIVTTIGAMPYSSKDKDGNLVARGYSINITRDGNKFGFGVSYAEAEILSVLFRTAILSMCKTDYK